LTEQPQVLPELPQLVAEVLFLLVMVATVGLALALQAKTEPQELA